MVTALPDVDPYVKTNVERYLLATRARHEIKDLLQQIEHHSSLIRPLHSIRNPIGISEGDIPDRVENALRVAAECHAERNSNHCPFCGVEIN